MFLQDEISLYTTLLEPLGRGKVTRRRPHSTPSMVCKGAACGLYDCNQFSLSLAFIFAHLFVVILSLC